jgi:hypothetical protein
MKHWTRFALWRCPTEWRGRYAREFESLLEDVRPGWREFWDVAGDAAHPRPVHLVSRP